MKIWALEEASSESVSKSWIREFLRWIGAGGAGGLWEEPEPVWSAEVTSSELREVAFCERKHSSEAFGLDSEATRATQTTPFRRRAYHSFDSPNPIFHPAT